MRPAITSEAVHDALRAIRSGCPLGDSPLLELASVRGRLFQEGVSDTPEVRSSVLCEYLDGFVWEHLSKLRGSRSAIRRDQLTPERELLQLQRDFQADSPKLEAWSIVYWHYFAVSRTSLSQMAARLGASSRTLYRRKKLGYTLLADAIRRRETELAQEHRITDGSPVYEHILFERQDRDRSPEEAIRALRSGLSSADEVVRLSPEEVKGIVRHPVSDLIEYRLGRIAEWSQPRYRLDERFVELSLLLDLGEAMGASRWHPAEKRFSLLSDVLAEVPDPAIVLLGAPGAGKSTLLRHFELATALNGLRQPTAANTFYISLSQYHPKSPDAPLPTPWEWLVSRWAARYPNLPSLEELLSEGGMVLLVDGLNEMSSLGRPDYRERILLWKQFLHELVGGSNRVVFACRSLDYSAPLSTPSLRVPQVRIEPMSDDQVQGFLEAYSPDQAATIWTELSAAGKLGMMRTPFFLKLLVRQVEAEGFSPIGQPALFTGLVRRALQREIERDNPLFSPGELITERDCRRALQPYDWATPFELPQEGELFPRLSRLAYVMQEQIPSGESSQVRMSFSRACRHLGLDEAEEVIKAGEALGVLNEDRDDVLFFHQLLQEYFAARALVTSPDPELVRSEWRANRISPTVDEVIDGLDRADPLPPLPGTGWEETTIMAVAMADDPGSMLGQLMEANLALAGRVSAQSEVSARLPRALLDDLRWELVRRSRDPCADLRDRIACGHAVGDLGDPRYERKEGPFGEYLMPPLVDISGGVYPIGHDEPVEWVMGTNTAHVPCHDVDVASFRIGVFPVTNAEWFLFMAGRGYDEERWWDTETGQAWRRGEGTARGDRLKIRYFAAFWKEHPELLAESGSSGQMPEELHRLWTQRTQMSASKLEAHILEVCPDRRHTTPRFWQDERLNHPAQPVTGISWYEARAYCNWLSAQTGLVVRLPTEIEWEAAARGKEGRLYAYGNQFDRMKGNFAETHVRQLCPVGVFPDGDTPDGLADMTGNSADWTSSAFGVRIPECEFVYPYDAADGREVDTSSPDTRRVVRGGGWTDREPQAFTFFRTDPHPTNRPATYGLGLRIAVDVTV